MSVELEKYENESGQVGVLVSAGCGAGWSTQAWAGFEETFLAMDKTLVSMKLSNESEDAVKDYLMQKLGKAPSMGVWGDVKVLWLDKGTVFIIQEYGGLEDIELVDDFSMTA